MAINTNKEGITLMDESGNSVQYARLQMRGGNEADFDPSKMLPREFAVMTDTEKVHIAFAPGKTKQLMTVDDALEEVQEKADEILASIPEDYTQLVDEVGSLSEEIDDVYNVVKTDQVNSTISGYPRYIRYNLSQGSDLENVGLGYVSVNPGETIKIHLESEGLNGRHYPWAFATGKNANTCISGYGEYIKEANTPYVIDSYLKVPEEAKYILFSISGTFNVDDITEKAYVISSIKSSDLKEKIDSSELEIDKLNTENNLMKEQVGLLKKSVFKKVNPIINNKDRYLRGNYSLGSLTGWNVAYVDLSEYTGVILNISIKQTINDTYFPFAFSDSLNFNANTIRDQDDFITLNGKETILSNKILLKPNNASYLMFSVYGDYEIGESVTFDDFSVELSIDISEMDNRYNNKIMSIENDMNDMSTDLSETESFISHSFSPPWLLENENLFSKDSLRIYFNSLKLNENIKSVMNYRDTQDGKTGTAVHDCTICKVGDKIYSVLTANNTGIGADNPKGADTVARFDIIDYLTKQVVNGISVAEKGEVIDGFLFATGTGVPNLYHPDSSDYIYVIFTASDVKQESSVDYNGKWSLFCAKYSISQNTFVSKNLCKFSYNGNTYDFNLPNLYDYVCKPNNVLYLDNRHMYFNCNSTIGEHNGQYYMAICIDRFIETIIMKTYDFINWEFECIPNYRTCVSFEAPVYIKDGILYLATRGYYLNSISAYDVEKKKWIDYRYIPSRGDSRPCFFSDGTDLYLWYTPDKNRKNGKIIKVILGTGLVDNMDFDRYQVLGETLMDSIPIADIYGNSAYPCVIYDNGKFIVSRSSGGIDISEFTIPNITDDDVKTYLTPLMI